MSKDNPTKAKERMSRYLENHKRLLVTGLSDVEYNSFISLPGETYKEKLLGLMVLPGKVSPENNKPLISTEEIKGLIDNSFNGTDINTQYSTLINQVLDKDIDYQGYKKQVIKYSVDINILINDLLNTEPAYNSPKNKEYWLKRSENTELRKAFDVLNEINSRIESIITSNYTNISEKELIELSKENRMMLLKRLKKLFKTKDIQKTYKIS